jgi:L-lysine exporter family protein LysE/ArgO
VSPLWQGILLGLGAAVPIGPVNVEIARRSLTAGPRAGFALGCGAVTVDITYAIFASLASRDLFLPHLLDIFLSLAAITLLLYLAAYSFRAAVTASSSSDPVLNPRSSVLPSSYSAYLTGLLMTLFNPMTLAFWFVAVPRTVGRITADPRHDLPYICLGVFLATFAWVIFFSTLLGYLGRFRRPWWIVVADIAGGAILLTFAVLTTVRLLRPLL